MVRMIGVGDALPSRPNGAGDVGCGCSASIARVARDIDNAIIKMMRLSDKDGTSYNKGAACAAVDGA